MRRTHVELLWLPRAARQAINSWVDEQTEDKIDELLGPDVLDDLTRLALANAIYFKLKT